MRVLTGEEENEALMFINKANEIAKSSCCLRSQCGSVIVKTREVIGKGFNSPPSNLDSQKRCLAKKEDYHKKVTDKTCCVHAEQRAILNALSKNPNKIHGSRLYFTRLKKGNIIRSGEPYCTICSKMALDVGIIEFVLWHEDGITVYDAEEYNNLSFKFKTKKT